MFREAIRRLAGVKYTCSAFYDPLRHEHREVSFGFLSYSLPLSDSPSRAWRFAWDPIFWELCSATAGALRFDLHVYRGMSPATRRLYLLLKKLFWRAAETPELEIRELGIDVLGFSANSPTKELKRKISGCVGELLAHDLVQLGLEQRSASECILKHTKGVFALKLYRGTQFNRSSSGSQAALNDSPLFDPLAAIGFDEASIRRILKQYPAKQIQLWADITLAAVEQKRIKDAPPAFFQYYIRRAAERRSTPPDWWREIDRRRRRDEEGQRSAREVKAAEKVEALSFEEYLAGDLIDGQQRIATFVLFARALELAYLSLAQVALNAADRDSESLAKTRARRVREEYLESEYEVNRRTVKKDRLELSQPDRQYFANLLHRDAQPETSSRESHSRLQAAIFAIRRKLDSLLASQRSLAQKLDILGIFGDILLCDCSVIHIVAAVQAEAYQLFQVLNNRGTNLTEGDLLRASTLELISSVETGADHEAAAEMWDDVLKDPPDRTENFLRCCYSSVKGKRPGESSLFDDFSDEFFPQHREPRRTARAAREVVAQIRQLTDEVRKYRVLADGDWPLPSSTRVRQWHRDRLHLLVRELSHTNCMPLLLAACLLDERKFVEIVDLIERFAFRYKYVCNLHIGSLTKVYHQQAVEIRNNPARYRVSTLRSQLQRLQVDKATDSLFGSLVNQIVYQPEAGNKVLKYFLMTVEHYWRWCCDGSRGDPKCRDTTRVFDFGATTLEHVYPQNAPAGNRDAGLEKVVNTLGNVTFLGSEDNDAAANSDFASKKPLFGQSSVLMNQDIAANRNWNVAAVRKRQKALTEMALRIFRV